MDAWSADVKGEKRWPMAVTLLVAMALPFLLPPQYSIAPRWIIPAIEALFLVALIVADPGRIDRRSTFVRTLSLGLVVILVAGAAGATVRLVIDLVRGGTETNSPSGLLRIGGVVWVYVIITFTFLYWELDGGGPEARARSTPEFPDLAFPQHLNPRVAWPWVASRVLRLPVPRLHELDRLQSHRCDASCPLGQTRHGDPGDRFTGHLGIGDRGGQSISFGSGEPPALRHGPDVAFLPAKLLSMSSPFWGSGVKTADTTMMSHSRDRGHALMKSRVS